ncbi:MAG: TetR/AcrR family transcriptional regulator [Candidatus Aminicenantia bacterium]
MSIKKIPTREKIILATINCIEKGGIQGVTIRGIAKEAKVNSAAINYYFGTKEKLVDEALKRTLDEMSKMPEELLDSEDLAPRARLQAFFTALMDGMFKWRGITKAHFYNPLMENNYNTLSVRRFNVFLADLTNRIKGLKPKNNGKDLKITIVQVISAIMIPALMPKIFRAFANINFENAETRKSYVTKLLDHFFE